MRKATILLEDGTEWPGLSFGAQQSCSGEIVFNTGMVGYPQSLTDPSYCGQILLFTYPLIGNYGVPFRKEQNKRLTYFEAPKIQASALVVSHYSEEWNHWNAEKSLGQWLQDDGIPALTQVDTRGLTKHLREQGTMLAKIIINDQVPQWYRPEENNLVAQVSCSSPQTYGSGSKNIILIDCGAKNQILHHLLSFDCTVQVVPWNHPIQELDCDGVCISNGPGSPEHCTQAIDNIRWMIKHKRVPIFGICMGHQLLGMAAGASIIKLKYGHRSQNQPVIEEGTTRCLITAQNHGYAVDDTTLSQGWSCWFRNLNDQTCAGIMHESGLFFSVQFHPEASPGPEDARYLFTQFFEKVEECS